VAGADPAVALGARWEEIAPALPAEWRHAPARLRQISGRVWKVDLPAGRALAVKRSDEAGALEREASVLRFLERRGCLVARVVAVRAGWLATEWAGDETLDDVLQSGGTVDAAELADAVRCVSDALAEVTQPTEAAVRALTNEERQWGDALPGTLEWLGIDGADGALRMTIEQALACQVRPGSLDYTARNVVIAPGGPVFLDFAATGFDWDERRLAQYALSAGAGRPNAEFRSALTSAGIDGLWNAEALDAHEVILLLIAAEQLRQVELHVAHAERVSAWRNVAQRKASLLRLLARPLCESGPAARLRRAFEA